MAISLSTISAIAARKGNEVLREQVNFKSAILKSSALKRDTCSGSVQMVNVQAGGLGSVAILTGDAAYPTAESQAATPLTVRPVSFVGHASIPFDAAELVSGAKDSIDLVKNQFSLLGQNLGQQLGRAVFDGYLSAVEATAAITAQAATVNVTDIAAFRVNQIVDIYHDNASTKLGSGRVASIARHGDGTGAVTFSGLVDGSGVALTGNVTVSQGIWLQGALTPAAGFRFTSLADICGSADLYGTTVSASDWSGTDTDAAGALSLESMRELCDDISQRSGSDPSHVSMGRLLFQDYEQLHVSNRRFMEGDTMDVFGKNALRPTFRGCPIVVDDNCPGRQVFFLNDEAVKLGVWREFAPMQIGKDMAEVSQTNYGYRLKVAGMFNLVAHRRNAVGRLRNVTVG